MDKVIATGIYCGDRITIEAFVENNKIKININEIESTDIQNRFYELVKNQPAIGGTYYPDPNSLLAAYNVLLYTFFDSLDRIDIVGKLGKIPCKDNKIY